MGEIDALLRRREFLEENISKMEYEIEKINKRLMFLEQASALTAPAGTKPAGTKMY